MGDPGNPLWLSIFLWVSIPVVVFCLGYVVLKHRQSASTLEQATHALWHSVATVGLLGAAVWTLHTFSALDARRKALAEAGKLDVEVEKLRESSVTLGLEASQIVDPVSNDYILNITTTIKNNGTEAAAAHLGKEPIKISRVRFGSGGELVGEEVIRAGLYVSGVTVPVEARGIFVMPQEARGWTTPVQVDAPGLYLVIVTIPRPPDDQAKAVHAGMPPDERAVWSASKLVSVDRSRRSPVKY
ncbi:MAG: hypothetical protein M3547_11185 [Acidobacteriota bacterium]|nr:hypothetical protein [Acidobacteriota bacterium]